MSNLVGGVVSCEISRFETGRAPSYRKSGEAQTLRPSTRPASTHTAAPPTMLQRTLHTSLRRLSPLHRALSTLPPSPSILSTVLPTSVDTTSAEFLERAAAMKVLEDDLKRLLRVVEEGGGAKAREKVRKAGNGKLLVRERCVRFPVLVAPEKILMRCVVGRIDKLLDPFSPFMELSPFAGHEMYEGPLPAAGIITGIGRISG
jgi:hypothetical protein